MIKWDTGRAIRHSSLVCYDPLTLTDDPFTNRAERFSSYRASIDLKNGEHTLRKLKTRPVFNSEKQEAAFWASHDSTEFIDYANALSLTFQSRAIWVVFLMEHRMEDGLFRQTRREPSPSGMLRSERVP